MEGSERRGGGSGLETPGERQWGESPLWYRLEAHVHVALQVRVHRDDEVVDAVHLDAVSRVEHQRDDFEALSGRESTMDPVLEDVLVELLVDLPADADVPIVASGPERTWIWSDLHPSDPSVLLGWGRPFRSVEEMNRHLLRNWRRRVGAG